MRDRHSAQGIPVPPTNSESGQEARRVKAVSYTVRFLLAVILLLGPYIPSVLQAFAIMENPASSSNVRDDVDVNS